MLSVALSLLLTQAPLPQDTPSRYDTGPRQEIAAARERWAHAGLKSYSFTVRLPCHPCPFRQIKVTVRRGEVTEAVLLSDYGKPGDFPKPLPRAEWQENLVRTVPALFDLTDTWLQDRRLYSRARFDAKYGFPESVWWAFASMETCCTEGHAGFSIVDFRAER